jgi:hypothetical protein
VTPKTIGLVACTVLAAGCDYVDTPNTNVVLANAYPATTPQAPVVYQAWWSSESFAGPVAPGASTPPTAANACSPTTAWVLASPGWDPATTPTPSSFVVLESRDGFALHLGDTLTISVDDSTFAGNCAAGSHLPQAEADFISQRVFAAAFVGLHYDAATCTTSPVTGGDAGTDAEAE